MNTLPADAQAGIDPTSHRIHNHAAQTPAMIMAEFANSAIIIADMVVLYNGEGLVGRRASPSLTLAT